MPDKNSLRRAIFAACRSRGFDDDMRKKFQKSVTGKASMTQMDERDMRKLLGALNGRDGSRDVASIQAEKQQLPGSMDELAEYYQAVPAHPEKTFVDPPERRKMKVLPKGPWVSKLNALWLSAYWLGVVRDPNDTALAAWIFHMFN